MRQSGREQGKGQSLGPPLPHIAVALIREGVSYPDAKLTSEGVLEESPDWTMHMLEVWLQFASRPGGFDFVKETLSIFKVAETCQANNQPDNSNA